MKIKHYLYNALIVVKNANPANDQVFKREVEKMGVACRIMYYDDEIVI